MRLSDSDNQLRLSQLKALFHALQACLELQRNLSDILDVVEGRVAATRLKTGRKVYQAEVWTLKERLYLCKLDILAMDGRMTTMIADLSRRCGVPESEVRAWISR